MYFIPLLIVYSLIQDVRDLSIPHSLISCLLLDILLSAQVFMSATPIDPSIGVTPLPMRFRKATKQLATLGPSSSSFEMIEKLFLSGKPPLNLKVTKPPTHSETLESDSLRSLSLVYFISQEVFEYNLNFFRTFSRKIFSINLSLFIFQ